MWCVFFCFHSNKLSLVAWLSVEECVWLWERFECAFILCASVSLQEQRRNVLNVWERFGGIKAVDNYILEGCTKVMSDKREYTHTHTHISAGFKSLDDNKQTTIRGSQSAGGLRRDNRGTKRKKRKSIFYSHSGIPYHLKRHKCKVDQCLKLIYIAC